MPSPQIAASGLSSVVGRDVEQWKTVDSAEPPALFHAKFWGKSMEIEEKEWRDSQPPVTGIGSELEDGELAGESCVQHDVDMTTGETTDMDESWDNLERDDIIPGCYMLDIGLTDFPYSKIWIRADYIRIFDYVQVVYDQRPLDKFDRWPPAVVITGQPGIGKSVWIYYALRRCLAERKPVIWYYLGAYYLFVEESVYKMPANSDIELGQFVWTLVDMDSSTERVPIRLAGYGTGHFIIYCTPPEKKRWSHLYKTRRDHVIVMSPWTRGEIIRAASLFPDRQFSDEDVDDAFDRLGPIPRLCLDYQDNLHELATYKRELATAIAKATPSGLDTLVKAAESLTMDCVSEKICLLSRKTQDVTSCPVVSVITPTVQSRLAAKFRDVPRDELLRLYKGSCP